MRRTLPPAGEAHAAGGESDPSRGVRLLASIPQVGGTRPFLLVLVVAFVRERGEQLIDRGSVVERSRC